MPPGRRAKKRKNRRNRSTGYNFQIPINPLTPKLRYKMKKLTNLFLLPALCLLLLAGALAQTAPADPLPTVPVGTVISYYGTTAPEGYFVCNGGSFSATTYPKLKALLGSNVLPDLRGYFIRGYDTRNTVDTNGAGRALGSEQGDAIRNIKGDLKVATYPYGTYLSMTGSNGVFEAINPEAQTAVVERVALVDNGGRLRFNASKVVPTADENRPKNKTLLYCIKHDEPETLPIPAKASTEETIAGVNDSKYTTPFGIKTAIDQAIDLIKQCACVKASIDEAVAGTDDAKYVTPAGLSAAIASQPAPQPIIPDLRLGVETVWPMRYQGKQVYAKLVNFGALPASGVRGVTHGILNIEWCQVSWDYSTVRKNDDPDLATLGVVSTAPPAYNIQWRIFVNKNSVQAHPLNSINTNTAWSAVVCVLYTKTTDEALP